VYERSCCHTGVLHTCNIPVCIAVANTVYKLNGFMVLALLICALHMAAA